MEISGQTKSPSAYAIIAVHIIPIKNKNRIKIIINNPFIPLFFPFDISKHY
jgi:hypothetical protein